MYNWNESVPIQLAQCWLQAWPFPMLKHEYIFQIKYIEAILSNSTRKLLWFEITKTLIAVLKNLLMVSFIVIFGTLSFPIKSTMQRSGRTPLHAIACSMIQLRSMRAVATINIYI